MGKTTCTGGTVCCPSGGTCVPRGAIMTECGDGGVAIECVVNGDCSSLGMTGAPESCCLGVTGVTTDSCNNRNASSFSGTECFIMGCPPNHVLACERQSDCPVGTNCLPFRALGRDWGGCF